MTADTLAPRLPEFLPEAAHTQEGGYLATGSPGRMAALLLLGKCPEGVPSVDIRAAIRTADPRVYDDERMKRLLRHLRDAGLAATERDDGGLRWYSPGARIAAQLRRGWQPLAAPTTEQPTTTTA